jgi:hypothetical protein
MQLPSPRSVNSKIPSPRPSNHDRRQSKDEEENVKRQTLSPTVRSRLVLLVLACVALLLVISLGQSDVGTAALSLFQSPASPVATPPEQPADAPAETASVEPPPSAAGRSIPTWVFIVVAVVVIALVVGFLLLRGR